MSYADIDVNALRKELQDEDMAGFFGAGIGGMLIDSIDLSRASDEEIIRLALQRGIDVEEYRR